MAKIYTKTGDKGQTGLVGGQRVSKNDPRIEAYGTVDELNCTIGLVRCCIEKILEGDPGRKTDSFARLNADLEVLQHWFFDLGSLLACEEGDRAKYKLSLIRPEMMKHLETRMDEATGVMPKLSEFILPGGSELASLLHLARTVARRAERTLLANESSYIPENAVPFINRVSDYLFVMARYANHLLGKKDVVWIKDSTV